LLTINIKKIQQESSPPLGLNRHTLQPNDTIPLENDQSPGHTYTTLQRPGTLPGGLQASQDPLRSKPFVWPQSSHQVFSAATGE
jgi:hypothetical protein